MRKFVMGAVAAGSIVGGSIAVAAVNPFGVAGAQDGTVPPATAPADPVPAPGAAPTDPGTSDPAAGRPSAGPHGGPGKALDDTLDELVANGTLTQAQADAVRSGVKDHLGKDGFGHGGPGMGHGPMDLLDTAASTIGVTPQELMEAVKGGQTVAQVAQAHGVDPQAVIDAVVTKGSERIDQAVADGKLPADKAEEAKARLREHVTKMVNESMPAGGPMAGPGGPGGPGGPMGRGHGRGHGGPGKDGTGGTEGSAPSTEAPTTEAPTTEAPTTEAPATTGTTA